MPVVMLSDSKYFQYVDIKKIDFIISCGSINTKKTTFEMNQNYQIDNIKNLKSKGESFELNIDEAKLFLYSKQLRLFRMLKTLEKPYLFDEYLFNNLKRLIYEADSIETLAKISKAIDLEARRRFINLTWTKLDIESSDLTMNLIDSLFFSYISYNLSKHMNLNSKIITNLNQDLSSLAIISKYLFAYSVFVYYELNQRDMRDKKLYMRFIYRLFNEKIIHKNIYNLYIKDMLLDFLSYKNDLKRRSLKELMDYYL